MDKEKNEEMGSARIFFDDLFRTFSELRPLSEYASGITEEAKKITTSRFGCICNYDKNTNRILSQVDSEEVWQDSGNGRRREPPRKMEGLLGQAMQTGQAVMLNRVEEDLRHRGFPENHLPIEKFLAVPLHFNAELLGQLALANPVRAYTDEDLRQVSGLASLLALIIHLHRLVETTSESENRAKALMDIPFDYVWLVDTNGRLVDLNQQALVLLRESRKDCIGEIIWQMEMHGRDGLLQSQIESVVKSSRALRTEIQRSDTVLDRQLFPIRDQGGSVTQVVIFEKDIDTEKKLHDLLLHYKYLDAVRSLAAGVAHNYNNIFGGLIGQFSMLRRGGLSPVERDEALGLIDELLQRGARISTKLSPFTRQDRENVRDVAPTVVIHEAAELLSLLSSSHRIVPRAEEDLPNLHCAPRRLMLNIYYLGRNAIEAMPDGGTVEIVASRGDDRFDPLPSVVFTVSDHGRGIAENLRERIFDPFFSTKQAGERQEIGLGLYTVKNYAHSQKGTLEFDTALDRGSTFRLILPAVPISRVKEELAFDTASASPPEDAVSKREEGSAPQVILLVEDEEALRTVITKRLQKTGNIVFSVKDGKEAIAEFAELHDTITTVIMDAGLPDMSGQQCVRRLMEIDPDLAVLYMSGDRLSGDELYPAGAPMLLKPFTANDLNKAIGNARKRIGPEIS